MLSLGVGFKRVKATRDLAEPIVEDSFAVFVAQNETRLRQALIARYGPTIGRDATAAAFAWAWEHWVDASKLENPIGYLFRVGQSSTRPHRAWTNRTTSLFPPEQSTHDKTHGIDLGLDLGTLLASLPYAQRVCVLLIHGYRWTYDEVAALLDISTPAVRNHVHRGVKRLRTTLEDEHE